MNRVAAPRSPVGAIRRVVPLVRHRPRVESASLHLVGLGLMFLVPGLVVSLVIEWASSTSHDEEALAVTTLVFAAAGVTAWMGSRPPDDISTRAVFAAVVTTWLVIPAAGALPYILSGTMFTTGEWDSALFESVSGFTATGSTVLADIEEHGRGLLMWRQLTQWYGGMGFVVLAVSVLPFLGVGGLELISAEAPGPGADRLAPRVSQTARRLWGLYCVLTGLIAMALFAIGGLGVYDAVSHALTAAATGGFSPYNASVGHFDSVAVETVLVVGMLLAAINFTLHWKAVNGDLSGYRRSADLHFYLLVVAAAIAATTFLNVSAGLGDFPAVLRSSVFNVVTIASTAGFGNATGPGSLGDFVIWTAGAQFVLFVLLAVGGSVGSTAGGLKVLRAQIAVVHTRRRLYGTLHPQAVRPLRLGRAVVAESVVTRALAFVTLFFMVATVGTLIVTATGADIVSAASAILTAMSGVGPGLGEAGPTANFAVFTRPARLVIAAHMIIGRIEIVPLLAVAVGMVRRAQATAGSFNR